MEKLFEAFKVFCTSIVVYNFLLWLRDRFPRRCPRCETPRRVQFYHLGVKVDEMNLKVDKFLPLTVKAIDEFGNPVGAFDAPPVFSSTNPDLASVEAAADGMSAVVKPAGTLGSCEIHVLAQAGGKAIEGSLALDLIPGDAFKVTIEPGAPVENDFTPPTSA